MRNGDPRLLSAGITRNSTFEADSGALREFVEQLQSRVGERQERIVEVERKIGRNSNDSSLPASRDDATARGERVNRAARRRAGERPSRRLELSIAHFSPAASNGHNLNYRYKYEKPTGSRTSNRWVKVGVLSPISVDFLGGSPTRIRT